MSYSAYIRHVAVALLALRAYRSKSLTAVGALTSLATGLVHSFHPWLLMFALLAGFYLPSSRFTKLKANIKAKLTVKEAEVLASEAENNGKETSKTGKTIKTTDGGEGPRTHVQVLSNSIVASVLILLHYFTSSSDNVSSASSWWSTSSSLKCFSPGDHLIIGIIAQYAAVTADTWSSELGILSSRNPILITTLRPCPKGTNGGVSPLGLGVALAAGAFIGSIAIFVAPLCGLQDQYQQELGLGWSVAKKVGFVGFMAGLGLFGSLVDSLLGALFQKSVVNESGLIIEAQGGGELRLGGGSSSSSSDDGKKKSSTEFKIVSGHLDLLTNNQVNLFMAMITSATGMALWSVFV